MTRCKKHFSDVSSEVGVCASCLRQRLFAVIAAQAQAHAVPRSRDRDPAHLPDDPVVSHMSLDPSQTRTEMIFPHSVSPYVAPGRDRDSRFYYTPESTKAEPMTRDAFSTWTGGSKHGRWRRKVSFFQHLLIFRSRSDRVVLETGHDQVPPGFERESPESSPSFLSFLKGRRKNRPPRQGNNTCYADDESLHRRRRRSSSSVKVQATPDRGFPEFSDRESWGGGYISERATPASSASTGRMRYGRGSASDVVGMRFWLSPLVRASTIRRWRHPLEEGTCSFEVRLPQAMAGKR